MMTMVRVHFSRQLDEVRARMSSGVGPSPSSRASVDRDALRRLRAIMAVRLVAV